MQAGCQHLQVQAAVGDSQDAAPDQHDDQAGQSLKQFI